jgi:exosortase
MPLLKRTVLFAGYALCAAVLSAPALWALIDLATHNSTASHVILVPFVSVALICLDHQSIFLSVRSSRLGGGSVILVGAGLAFFANLLRMTGTPNAAMTVGVLALVVLWVGGFLLFYGRSASRAALFPLLFLVFMIPIPKALLDGATLLLKTGSTVGADVLFGLSGTPYHRQGFTFSLPTLVIEVGDECSGIRSSIALLLTTLLAGHRLLTSPWKKTLLVLAAVPVAVIKNAVRIVTLTLLAAHVDPGFLTGQLHHEGGIVFYLLALVILAPVLAVLRRSELKRCTLAQAA